MLSWPTVEGLAYQLESNATFDGSQWDADGEVVLGNWEVIDRVIPVSEQAKGKFYRLIESAAGGQ